jgi:hypothetical protein
MANQPKSSDDVINTWIYFAGNGFLLTAAGYSGAELLKRESLGGFGVLALTTYIPFAAVILLSHLVYNETFEYYIYLIVGVVIAY